jgi:hypothetical protein
MKRFSAALTSWFRIQEQGMLDFEVLSRASAVVTKSLNNQRVQIITSQHVTHPFLWRKYYPKDQFEWLDFVKKEHLKFKLEIRNENGELHRSLQLNQHAIHPNLDLSVLHFEDESEFSEFQDICLKLHDQPPQIAQNVFFSGLEFNKEAFIPRYVNGRVTFVDKSGRAYAMTDELVTQGMCGGPVLLNEEYCAGMLEGLVSNVRRDDMQMLKNNAVFIPSSDIIAFLKSINN